MLIKPVQLSPVSLLMKNNPEGSQAEVHHLRVCDVQAVNVVVSYYFLSIFAIKEKL
jgi:hypothetical protein